MKTLYLKLSVVALLTGMLGASACSGCMPPPEDTSSSSVSQPMSYKCGPGTKLVGRQCVADSSSSGASPRSTTLNTTGNN